MENKKDNLKIEITLAKQHELDELMPVYEYARGFMRQTGNPTQWAGGYPKREILEQDIEKNQLYNVRLQEQTVGAFVFFVGKESTYNYIEGAWNKEAETTGVIHRVASNGKLKGMFKYVEEFCISKTPYLRIDTHKDNTVMQHVLK